MSTVINVILIIISILLIITILMQNRGSGVGDIFGGGGEVHRTKRGAEKLLFNGTIILAILFFGIALYNALFII